MWQTALACPPGVIALASCVLDSSIVSDHPEERQTVSHGVWQSILQSIDVDVEADRVGVGSISGCSVIWDNPGLEEVASDIMSVFHPLYFSHFSSVQDIETAVSNDVMNASNLLFIYQSKAVWGINGPYVQKLRPLRTMSIMPHACMHPSDDPVLILS